MKTKISKPELAFDPKLIDAYDKKMNSELYVIDRQVKENKDYEQNLQREYDKTRMIRIRNEEKQRILAKKKEETKDQLEVGAREMHRSLSKHAGIASLCVKEMNGVTYIIIQTPLLFTPIRTKVGARKEKRACIGQYEVRIGVNKNHVQVFNKTFKNHWAIRDGNPCKGSYQSDMDYAYTKGDWYALFDVIYHYLHSTDDGSAYERSHEWRDRRQLSQLIPKAEKKYEFGEYAIITSTNTDGKNILGHVGRVLGHNSEELMCLEFRVPIGGHTGPQGKGRDLHCWNIGDFPSEKITEAQYLAQEVYTSSGVDISEETFTAIDALPDGSTQEDAAKLAQELYKPLAQFKGL